MSTIAEPGQFITFRLGDETFAITVSQVREILDLSEITKVPTAPPYMRGVVNVRGKATPVVDLRLKFGLPLIADTLNTRIVVLELEIDGETAVVGGLADSVEDVITLEPAQIDPPPKIASRWRSEFISGMGRIGEQFVMILDINAVFAREESAVFQAAHTAADAGL